MRYIALIGQFILFLAVLFIVGQAAIIPVQDSMADQENHDIENSQGDVILDGESWFTGTQRTIFQWLPYMIMLGIPALALLYYLRLTQVGRGGPPGGGFR